MVQDVQLDNSDGTEKDHTDVLKIMGTVTEIREGT